MHRIECTLEPTEQLRESACRLSHHVVDGGKIAFRRRELIDIVVDLRVKAGPQLHEVCEVLQRRVRETMSSGLGIADVRRVEVSVKEISSEHKDA